MILITYSIFSQVFHSQVSQNKLKSIRY